MAKSEPIYMICKGVLRAGQMPRDNSALFDAPIELLDTDTIEVIFTGDKATLKSITREGVVIWEKANE